MELRSTRDSNYLYIDWWLMNHCNYNCSYCPDILKNGSIDLPNIVDCKAAVDQINSFAVTQGKRCYYYFTGGEVTQWPWLIDLTEHIKLKNNYVRMRTNASMSITEWQRLISSVDSINIEVHSEHTPVSHFMLCLHAAKKKNVDVSNNSTDTIPTINHNFNENISFVKDSLVKPFFDQPMEDTDIQHSFNNNCLEFENVESADYTFKHIFSKNLVRIFILTIFLATPFESRFIIKSTPDLFHTQSDSGICGFPESDFVNTSNIYGITSPLLVILILVPFPIQLSNIYLALNAVAYSTVVPVSSTG
jgi:organic radical activating enzyme